jgi:hypothetical protein
VERPEAGEVVALRIESRRATDILILGSPGTLVGAADVETDARMLGARLTAGGTFTRVAMLDGTFARRASDGAPLLPAGRGGEGLVTY